MRFPLFIVRKIAFSDPRAFSRLIIGIAISAVAVSLAVMIIAMSIVRGFQQQVSTKVYDFWSHLYVTHYAPGTNYAENPVPLEQDFYVQSEAFPYITHIQPTAVKGGILYASDLFEGLLLKGVSAEFHPAFEANYLLEGKMIQPGSEEAERDIVISRRTAERLKAAVGDAVTVSFMDQRIRMRKFTISGIYNTGIEEFDPRFAFVDLRIIQQLNGWGADTVGGFEIFVDDVNRLEEYADDLYFKKADNNLRVETVVQKWRGIFDWLRLQSTNEWIILGIMAIVAMFNMVTALLILIVERSRMIGVLKSLGAGNAAIRNIFLLNGGIIIGCGLLLGNLAGIGLSWIQLETGFVRLPEETYYLDRAPVELSWWRITLLNLGAAALCLLVLFLPSALIARIMPVKVLRFD